MNCVIAQTRAMGLQIELHNINLDSMLVFLSLEIILFLNWF